MQRKMKMSASALALFALLSVAVATSPAAQAVHSSAPSPFNVRGEGNANNVVEVTSPNAYNAPGAYFLDNSKTPLQLTNIRYFVVKGQITPSGAYTYPYSFTARSDIQLGGIELAINENNHTQLVAVGVPTAASSAAVDRQSGQMRKSAQPLTSGTKTAPLHLIWKDPTNIWVAEVMDDLQWSYDGNQVYGCEFWDRWEHWYTPTGWSRNYATYHGPTYSGTADCTLGTSAQFTNWAFCDPNKSTTIAVDYNNATGYYDGTRYANIGTYVFGDCASNLNYFWQWG